MPSVAAASLPARPACSRSVHAAGISRLVPSGSTTSNSSRAVPAHAAQHRAAAGPRSGCRGRVSRTVPGSHGGHRPASVTTCTRRPGRMAHRLGGPRGVRRVHAQGRLAQVNRDALGDAGRDQQHLPLPVRARQHRPAPRPLPRRSRPPRPPGPGTAPTRLRPRPAGNPPAAARHGAQISSSAAASVGSQPFAHARIAAARSSKHVVRRGVLRRNLASGSYGPGAGPRRGQTRPRPGKGIP